MLGISVSDFFRTLCWSDFGSIAVTVTTSFKIGATLLNSSYCLSKGTSSALLISGNLKQLIKWNI